MPRPSTWDVSLSVPRSCVIPAFVRNEEELDVLLRCLVSLRTTAPDAEVLVVDDASPATGAGGRPGGRLRRARHRPRLQRRELRLLGHRQRRPASSRCTPSATPSWSTPTSSSSRPAGSSACALAPTRQGRPAAVVGARLLYPNGLIQHAGIFLSPLHRDWLHRFQYGPADLPEALRADAAARSPPRCS